MKAVRAGLGGPGDRGGSDHSEGATMAGRHPGTAAPERAGPGVRPAQGGGAAHGHAGHRVDRDADAAHDQLVGQLLDLDADLRERRHRNGGAGRGADADLPARRRLQQRRQHARSVRRRAARRDGDLRARHRRQADPAGAAAGRHRRQPADGRHRGGDGPVRQRDQGLRHQVLLHRQRARHLRHARDSRAGRRWSATRRKTTARR